MLFLDVLAVLAPGREAFAGPRTGRTTRAALLTPEITDTALGVDVAEIVLLSLVILV